jgi:hypothetical protein
MRVARCITLLNLALFVMLALAASPAAASQGCNAPTGTAAIDQYCETFPLRGRATRPRPPARRWPRSFRRRPPGGCARPASPDR